MSCCSEATINTNLNQIIVKSSPQPYNVFRRIILLSLIIMICFPTNAQKKEQVITPKVSTAKYFRKTKPLRDITPIPPNGEHRKWKNNEIQNNFERREYVKGTAPGGGDPVLQKSAARHSSVAPLLNFEGVRADDNSSIFIPPDTDGDVSSSHYFQMVNVMFEIFDKSGNSVYGPADNSTLWDGFEGDWTGTNDGDPIVLYDQNADRWIATQFALPNGPWSGPFFELIAISETNDPLGSWYQYAFEFSTMPDYPKFGIWHDGYYMTLNTSGDDAIVFERDEMLNGNPDARMVTFKTPGMPGSGFKSALPASVQGTMPPAGAPNYFIYFNDNGWGGDATDKIMIWEFDVDWSNTSNSTMTLEYELEVDEFDSEFDADWNDIEQPGTSQRLDGVPGAIMFRLQYRNFGSHESIVANHTVDVDATDHAGIRWYELRNDGSGWEIYQQSTFAPDEDSRWMGSIAMDGEGNIGLGYSVSGASTFPSIRFTGRLASDPLNQMTFDETDVVIGEYTQSGTNRWGDYSMMSVDPGDDATFWYTNEYIDEDGEWLTQIASFQLKVPSTSFVSYTLENQYGNTTIDAQAEEIRLEVEYETDVTSLIATFELPDGSSVTVGGIPQESGVTANNFTSDVVYRVTDSELNYKDWTVKVTEEVPESKILSFSFPDIETRQAIIDDEAFTVDAEISYSADITALVAEVELSRGAIAYVDGVSQVTPTTTDFTDAVIYDVVAMDGSSQEWTVTVSKKETFCEAGAGCDEYISRVEFVDIDNESDCDGYISYDISTEIQLGETYPITITNGNPYSSDECVVWIDWDNNRVFDDTPITMNGSPGNGPYTADVTVPMDAFMGEIFMRVRIDYNNTPEPCGTTEYGEIEDYKLVVISNIDTEAEILSYYFEADTNDALENDIPTEIGDGEIIAFAPYGTVLTELIANFELSKDASMELVTVPQVSGITENDFSSPVSYVVTAEDGTTKNWTVTVKESNLVSYKFEAALNDYIETDIIADPINGEIKLDIPYHAEITSLIASFELNTGASAKVGTVDQESGVTANDFSDAVTYTIIGADATEEEWEVMLTQLENNENELVAFSFLAENNTALESDVVATIENDSAKLTVPYYTDLSSIAATFTLSDEAIAKIGNTTMESGVTLKNYTSPVTFEVIAQNGDSKDWTIVVSKVLNSDANFESFKFEASLNDTLDADIIGVIENDSVKLAAPFGTAIDNLIPTFTISGDALAKIGETVQVSGETANDFSETVAYTVHAQDESTKVWEIVTSILPNTESDILSYMFEDANNTALDLDIVGEIDNSTVELEVAHGTDISALVATFTLSDEASAMVGDVDQESAVTTNDFAQPVTYKVYAGDGSMTEWLVTVNVEPNDEADIVSFKFETANNAQLSSDIDGTVDDPNVGAVAFEEIDLTELIASFILSDGASAKVDGELQESGISVNDFTDSVMYVVTAENNEDTKTWTVKVSINVSVDQLFGKEILIYPNPVESILHINGIADAEIKIFNMKGELVVSKTNVEAETQIDVSNYQNGAYLVNIIKDGKILIKKIQILK